MSEAHACEVSKTKTDSAGRPILKASVPKRGKRPLSIASGRRCVDERQPDNGSQGEKAQQSVAIQGKLRLRNHRNPRFLLQRVLDRPSHLARVFNVTAQFFEIVLTQSPLC